MPDLTPKYGDLVKFQEAISFYRQKILIPTESWRDLQGLIHSKAFTVAGATEVQLLLDLYKDVEKAISDGETISQFRKRFDTTVNKHGWSYNGRRGWRSQVIYQNNKNTARAAGRWQQQERLAHKRPYLLYLTAGDSRVREDHARWNYLLLPVDHPFWNTHYPPNGWNCRCKVVSVNERDIKRMGLTHPDPDSLSEHLTPFKTIDKETGEELIKLPGIDLGWDYNPGKAWLGSDIALGKTLIDMGTELRQYAIPQFNQTITKAKNHYKNSVSTVAAKVATNKITKNLISDGKIFTLGHISNDIIDTLITKTQPITNSLIAIESDQIALALKAGVSIESVFELMTLAQQPSSYSYKAGIIKLVRDGIMITIELSTPFNKVTRIEKL